MSHGRDFRPRDTERVNMDCLACDGTGKVPNRGQRANSLKRVDCAVCYGLGFVKREQ